MRIIKGVSGILLSLFFMGYGVVTFFQGEWAAGLLQIGFGALIFAGGVVMIVKR